MVSSESTFVILPHSFPKLEWYYSISEICYHLQRQYYPKLHMKLDCNNGDDDYHNYF